MPYVDLHTHTTASDGSLTPAELVRAAADAGLAAVAITDHDTIAGVAEALAAGRELPIEVVPGVEISMAGGPKGSMHLLGLFIDHHNPDLKQSLQRLQAARAQRNPQIARRLQELGIPLTMDEVSALAGGGQVGRPHFAQALIARGVVANRGEAFGRFLAAGKPAYVDKFRFQPAEAIAMVKAAGGVPILAHPGLLGLGMAALENLVAELVSHGLAGIEVYYSEHDNNLARRLAALAARRDLVISGGTDFHGDNKKDIHLGVGQGTLRVPDSLLGPIRRLAADGDQAP